MQILKNVGTTLSYPWPMSSAQILSVITSIATQNPGYRKIYGLQTVTSGGASTQRVAWVKANFLSGIPFRMSATKLELEYFKFLDFIAEFEATTFQYSATNANGSVTLHSAPPTASATVRVTSECWVRMATELQAIRGTVSSIAVSLAFAVFATLIFTGDVFVALMALLSMLAIILAVIAILVALKVKFGIVEAISLTILVGISVDFSLHLAESFTRSHFTSRGLRGVDAVSRVGYPIFSAAMTTMSAVIPMLWCQVQVLVRFGQIIPLCIVMSLVYGVHFFLPMLMSFGPNVPGGGAGKWLCHMGKLPGLLFSTQTRRMIFLVASGMIFGFLLPATRALLYRGRRRPPSPSSPCGFAFLSAVAVFVERRCRRRAVAEAADVPFRDGPASLAPLDSPPLAPPSPPRVRVPSTRDLRLRRRARERLRVPDFFSRQKKATSTSRRTRRASARHSPRVSSRFARRVRRARPRRLGRARIDRRLVSDSRGSIARRIVRAIDSFESIDLNNLIAIASRSRLERTDAMSSARRDDARDDRVEVGDGEARDRREGGAKNDAATREGRRSDDGGDSAGGDESDG